MRRVLWVGVPALLLGALGAAAQDSPSLRPGLKEGEPLPKGFSPYNFNGERKGFYSDLLGRYNDQPAVLVFAPVRDDGNYGNLDLLLKRLDEAAEQTKGKQYEFHAGVVYL